MLSRGRAQRDVLLFRAGRAQVPGLGCGRAALSTPRLWVSSEQGLEQGREPDLSHKPSVAAVLWEQPEMAQQRFGKVSPEWSPGSLTGGHLEPSPVSVTGTHWDVTLGDATLGGGCCCPCP